MKKIKLAILAIAGVLSVVSYAFTPFYIGVVVLLGWRSYAAFVPLAGLLAWFMVYFQGDTENTLKDLIEHKIKGKRVKKLLLYLFKVRSVAVAVATIFLGPFLTPIVVNLCVKGSKRVYFWAVVLNMAGSAIGIFVYQGGWELVKIIWGLNWIY